MSVPFALETLYPTIPYPSRACRPCAGRAGLQLCWPHVVHLTISNLVSRVADDDVVVQVVAAVDHVEVAIRAIYKVGAGTGEEGIETRPAVEIVVPVATD